MKLTIDRGELLTGLARVQGIVERRGTLPILANALIEARQDGIKLAATDLEVGFVASIDARVESEGSVTLGAKKLHEIVRELDESDVAISTEDGSRVGIECGPAHFSLLAIAPEEYPTIPGAEGVSFVPMEAALLAEMIDRTLYSASTDETRYNLNGVYVEGAEKGRIRFVSTDGHRLAKVEKTPAAPVDFLEKGIIVPRKGMVEIRKLCEETEGSLEIGLGDGFLILRRPDLLLTSRLIDGEFVNFRQILPSGHKVRLVIDRERLIHAVRRMSLVAHERSRGFSVQLADGQIELSASSPELGEAREALPVDYSAPPFESAFNARYVLDALAAMASKEVVIELSEQLSPAQFRPADDPDQVAVIMPMRL